MILPFDLSLPLLAEASGFFATVLVLPSRGTVEEGLAAIEAMGEGCERCRLRPDGGVGGRPMEGRIWGSAGDEDPWAASRGFRNIAISLSFYQAS